MPPVGDGRALQRHEAVADRRHRADGAHRGGHGSLADRLGDVLAVDGRPGRVGSVDGVERRRRHGGDRGRVVGVDAVAQHHQGIARYIAPVSR